MPDTHADEPSMDEILASIRKIVADDVHDAGTSDELLLTQRVVAEPAPAKAPDAEPQQADDGSVGNRVAAEAFDRLAVARQEIKVDRQSPDLPPGNRNLEDLVREMLEPTLRAWLDEHLPSIVQERVDEEIAHISRRRVR